MTEGQTMANVVRLPESGLIIDILDISYILHIEINKYGVVCKRPNPNMPVLTGVDLDVLLKYMGEAGLFAALEAPPKVVAANS